MTDDERPRKPMTEEEEWALIIATADASGLKINPRFAKLLCKLYRHWDAAGQPGPDRDTLRARKRVKRK